MYCKKRKKRWGERERERDVMVNILFRRRKTWNIA